MAIEFEKIANSKNIPLIIKDLYTSSFPAEERRPWDDIVSRIDNGDNVFNFYVLKHKNSIAGFATLWRLPGALYCEHFAILPSLRGSGLGAMAVKEMIARVGEDAKGNKIPLVLEVELPEASLEASRRISFYERCGLRSHDDFPYWQPPYQRELPEVPMMLMSAGEIPDRTSFVMILHTIVYNQ